jgi:hypothetical protein
MRTDVHILEIEGDLRGDVRLAVASDDFFAHVDELDIRNEAVHLLVAYWFVHLLISFHALHEIRPSCHCIHALVVIVLQLQRVVALLYPQSG